MSDETSAVGPTREIAAQGLTQNSLPHTAGYGTSYALVIGIDAYEQQRALLNARKDAEAVANLLADRFGFHVTTLFDEAATLEAILQQLRTELPARLNEDDRLLIFFSGHGAGQPGRTDDLGYLVPYGADDGYGDYLSMRELLDSWERIKAKHMLIILDCCFSGLAAKFRSTTPLPPADYGRAYVEQVTSREAFQVLTAGTQNELAFDISESSQDHSVFTAALLAGLNGKAARNSAGFLMASELAAYVETRVAEETVRRFGRAQTPYFTDLPGTAQGNFMFLFDEAQAPSQPSAGKVQAAPVLLRSAANESGSRHAAHPDRNEPAGPNSWLLYALLAGFIGVLIIVYLRVF